MRIHKVLAQASVDLIRAVFNDGKVLDHELAKAFKANRKWGKRDRGFIAETTFEVTRWRRALAYLAQDDSVEALCTVQWTRMGYAIPDWWDRHEIAFESIAAREEQLADQPRAIRESVPDWLDRRGVEELGDAWESELTILNNRTRVYLRVNTLKATRAEAIAWLAGNGITAEAVDGLPQAIALNPGKTLPRSLLENGMFEIQDAGSQMIAPLVDPQPGEYVIDACAGAGGKTLHLAALMQNQGTLLAMDVQPSKLRELERRAKRADASALIETTLIGPTTIKEYKGVADCLLIDAPCSGLGTLRRQPDLKWRLTEEKIEHLHSIQTELLNSYPTMLKPDGRLVYATCSLLPSENQMQLERFLERGDFKLLEEEMILPSVLGYDGFYAAVLRKYANE
ncbi:MAG: RNA methyltransferase [Verrucomicrobiota bacterium]